MIRNVKDIRDDFFDKGKLSAQSMKDLVWHIENDPLPDRAISFVTDAGLMELVPLIAKHLDHEDDFIREITVGSVVGGGLNYQTMQKRLSIWHKQTLTAVRVV